MINRRQYELSLWTHDDIFIITLGSSLDEFEGRAVKPTFTQNVNGTQTLKFQVPLVQYDKEAKQFVENPRWYSAQDELRTLLNERKIKLIYDKFLPTQEIYEFIVTKMDEIRDGRKLTLAVEADGLAFHELGKIGSEITLNSEILLIEEQKEAEATGTYTVIAPTINFWLGKVFPTGDLWTYGVQMNYPGEPSKDSSKIYEPAHPVGWIDNPDGTVTADVQAPLTEKERFIDVKDSNKYNITQDIAEVFEVYVKYVYEYNDATHPFKITGRKIVFYSDLVSASPFEINYGANLNSLKRTIDSSNIVTKMFVTPIASEYSDSGYISIAESDQNKMRDTFILNFDYFYEAGMLTDAQYQSIPIFEANLRKANISLEQILNKANDLSNEETTLTAKRATLLDRQTAAQDVINDCTDRLDLMNKGLTTNILTQDKEQYVVINDNNVLKILVKRKGVLNNAALVVTGATQAGIFTDEYGYVTEVCVSGAASGTYIYLTYQYDVLSYYRNVLQTYEGIHAAVTAQLASVNIQLGDEETTVANANGNLYERINANNAAFTTASDAKNKLVYDFNKMMGFYLREGKWQSNDYSISPFSKSSNVTAIYDATVFKGEQEPFYYKDVALTKQYYPYIDLYSLFSASFPTNFTPSKLVLKETWVDAAGKPMIKSYVMGAQCQMALIKVGTVIHPIVMILEDILSSNTHDFTLIYNSAVPITVTSIMKRSSSTAYQLIKKRVLVDDKNIVLSSFNVEKNPNTAGVIYNEYEDYNIARLDGKVYITFNINDKISWSVANFHISYQCNRSTEQFYLDALDVMSRSAIPNTSYTIDAADIYIKDRNEIYKPVLGGISRINDAQMHFHGVKGYVSEIAFDLDRPDQTKISIQNYKTKFEDLFTKIVASSEQMKTRGASYERAADAITPTRELDASILQRTLDNNNISFKLGMSSHVRVEDRGLIIENAYPYPSGVTGLVALMGGGIYLSDTIDPITGDRIWHTGITPSGINAALITSGQLDVNKINIFSGSQVRFAWKGEGLFAYANYTDGSTDFTKWIRFNEDGLVFRNGTIDDLVLDWNGLYIGTQGGAVQLTSLKGLQVFDEQATPQERIQIGRIYNGDNPTNQYGIRMKNLAGSTIFETDNDGNLSVTGSINATSGIFSGEITVGATSGISGRDLTTQEFIDLMGGLPPDMTQEEFDQLYNQYKTEYAVSFWAGGPKTNAKFMVFANGSVIATEAEITGDITATSGVFTGKVLVGEQGNVGFYGYEIIDDPTYVRMYAGNWDGTNYPFEVHDDGSIYSGSATIIGDITANSGKFLGMLTIGESAISGIDGTTNIDVILWAGATDENDRTSSKFYVTNDGSIYSKALYLTDTAQISKYVFLGNEINDLYYKSGLYGETSAVNPLRLWFGAVSEEYDTANLRIYEDGAIFAKSLNMTGSLIADNAILSGKLNLGKMLLNGSPDSLNFIGSKDYIKDGLGWRIDENDYAEFNNVTIRGKIRSVVFEYNSISAIGGDLYINPTILTTADALLTRILNTNDYQLTFTPALSTDEDSLWLSGATIKLQGTLKKVQTDGTVSDTVNLSNITVTHFEKDVDGVYSIIFTYNDKALDGYTLNAGASLINLGMNGNYGIHLSARQSGGPFINIFGLDPSDNKTVTCLGNLENVQDYTGNFGTLSGFGLYSNNAYLTGKLYLPNAGITNEGADESSVRIWAGSSPGNRDTAPFRVTQDGSLYATKGVFKGTVEAVDSSFSGTIQTAGIVIDDQNPTDDPNVPNILYVAYNNYDGDNKLLLNRDNLIVSMSVDGLEIYEGGLKVYSDAADGWYNGVKDPLYTWEPYGGIASPYPYIAAVDSGLRLSAAFGHFWLVDTEGSFVSTAIEGNTIRFGQATNAVSVGDFLPTEHAVYTHNSQAIMGMLGDTDAFSVCAKSSQNTPAYVLFNSFVDDSYYTATNQVRVGINNANPNTALDVVGGITTSGEFNLGDAKFIEVGVKGEASYGFDITI